MIDLTVKITLYLNVNLNAHFNHNAFLELFQKISSKKIIMMKCQKMVIDPVLSSLKESSKFHWRT